MYIYVTAVLYCAVLCCAMLCCAVLCCAVLCCAVLCCAVLCCSSVQLLLGHEHGSLVIWNLATKTVDLRFNVDKLSVCLQLVHSPSVPPVLGQALTPSLLPSLTHTRHDVPPHASHGQRLRAAAWLADGRGVVTGLASGAVLRQARCSCRR